MADLAHNLDEVFADVPAAEPAAVVEQPQAAPEQVRQPAEPEPIATEQPTTEPQPEEPKGEHHVPLAKYLDTRDELKELKRWKAEQEARVQAPQPAKAPDPIDDPEGHTAYLEQRLEQRVTAQRFQTSELIAKQTHGEETVDKAAEWALERAQADPVFAAQYMREAHPIDWIVRQHKQQALVAQLPSDVSSIDDWFEREAAKRGYVAGQPAAPAAITPLAPAVPPAPPRSHVNAPSGGGVAAVPLGLTAAVEAAFPR